LHHQFPIASVNNNAEITRRARQGGSGALYPIKSKIPQWILTSKTDLSRQSSAVSSSVGIVRLRTIPTEFVFYYPHLKESNYPEVIVVANFTLP
jgi:hypothetical protein